MFRFYIYNLDTHVILWKFRFEFDCINAFKSLDQSKFSWRAINVQSADLKTGDIIPSDFLH